MAKQPFPFGNCSETANQLDSRCDDGNQQLMAKQPFPVLAERLQFMDETQWITKNGQRTNKLINELLENESFFIKYHFIFYNMYYCREHLPFGSMYTIIPTLKTL